MLNLRSEVLTDLDDQIYFHKRACILIGVDFPFEYFSRAIIRGFKNNDNKILGGYVIARSAPFRTLDSIPDNVEVTIDVEKICEVTGMWLEPQLRAGFLSFIFWLQFSRDLYNQKDKNYYVYAYSLGNKKLKKLYSLANPRTLYEGKVKRLKGNKKESLETIEIASRFKIGFLPIYGFLNLLSKLFLNRKMVFSNLFHKTREWNS